MPRRSSRSPAFLTHTIWPHERYSGVLLGSSDVIYTRVASDAAGAGAHQSVAMWSAGSVDADLYVRCNAYPTPTAYGYRDFRSGTSSYIHIPSNQCVNGTWYVAIHSYSGSGQFNLVWSQTFIHYPEMTSVAATLRVTRPTANDRIAHFDLVPSAPLAAGQWYAVTLSANPPGLVRTPTPLAMRDNGAGVIARFRIDSDPGVRGIEVCDNLGNAVTGRVLMTEPVSATALELTVSATGGSCGKNPIVKLGPPDKPDNDAFQTIDFGCTDAAADTEFAFSARGVRTAGSSFVNGRDVAERRFRRSSLALSANGCRVLAVD